MMGNKNGVELAQTPPHCPQVENFSTVNPTLHFPFDPPKMLFRGLFYKLSSKCPPPHDYPDISEPVIGRAKIVHYLILAVSPNSFCV